MAAERVQAELNYIFTARRGNKWSIAATNNGLLGFWLPSITPEKIEQLNQLEDAIALCSDLGLDTSELCIPTKLATLVSTQTTAAEAELTKLKYSRAQIKAVVDTLKHLPHLQTTTTMSLRSQYFWFLSVKAIFPILMVRAIATGVSLELLRPLIERYLDPTDPVAHPQPLLTGNDLIRELNLKPSVLIGKLLTEIQIARVESKISTPQEALHFATFVLQTWSRNE